MVSDTDVPLDSSAVIPSPRRSTNSKRPHRAPASEPLPRLLTPEEVGTLLRKSTKSIYAMTERFQLPGVIRIGRRVLIRQDDLLDFLRQSATPLPERDR